MAKFSPKIPSRFLLLLPLPYSALVCSFSRLQLASRRRHELPIPRGGTPAANAPLRYLVTKFSRWFSYAQELKRGIWKLLLVGMGMRPCLIHLNLYFTLGQPLTYSCLTILDHIDKCDRVTFCFELWSYNQLAFLTKEQAVQKSHKLEIYW